MVWAKKTLPLFAESVATIEDAYRATHTDKTLILIQDAHTNDSGQLNLAKTLDLILQKDPMHYIFLEAGSGDVSLSFLRKYADKAKRKRVAGVFLRRGELQGSEYLDLVSDHSLVLWGVEDQALYAESVSTYREAVKVREKFQEYLNKVSATARILKPKIYNPFLLAFDEKYEKYRNNKISLTEYFEMLSEEAKRLDLTLRPYPHLEALQNLKTIESKIDFKKAGDEQVKAVLSLSEEDQKELRRATQDMRLPLRISTNDNQVQKAYFALLEEKCARDLKSYPELAAYFRYLTEAKKIQAKAILEEQKALEKEVFRALVTNPDEDSLVRASVNVRSLKKLMDLTLTPDEYEDYRKNAEQFDIARITGFLNKKIMDLRSLYDKAVFLENDYERAVLQCEAFYELTYKRDEQLVRNALAKMGKENEQRAILITGGYHTPNLKYLLKERGISFISVTPQVFHETNQKRYEQILLSQKMNGPGLPTGSFLAGTNMTWQVVMDAAAARLASNRLPRRVKELVERLSNDGGPPTPEPLDAFIDKLMERDNFGTGSGARMADDPRVALEAEPVFENIGARLATPPQGQLQGFAIAKLMTLIDQLRSYNLSPKEYEEFGGSNFEAMRVLANQKSRKIVFSDLDGIPAARIDTLGQYQAEAGRAIHEIVKNAADWSVGRGRRPHRRSSKHGVGAFQILGELDAGVDYMVIETKRLGQKGLRVTLWNQGYFDYRVHYEFVEGLPDGTKVSMFKQLDDKEQAQRATLLREKLKVHTAGPILVNGQKVNTPEEYTYAGPQGGGLVDESTSPVEVQISAEGWSVQDHGFGMDLKAVMEDFLSPHYSGNGELARSKKWSANQIKLFSKPKTSRTTRVAMWINGHEITSYSNADYGERLNLTEEMILDFPYGTPAPNSWNRVEMDSRVILGIKKVIGDITDPEKKNANPFAQINSMAILIQSLNENPKAQELLLSFLKQRTQALIQATKQRGQKIILVPNHVRVPGRPYEWAMFDDEAFVPLDSVLLDFNLDELRQEGLLTEVDDAFRQSVLLDVPHLQQVPFYIAHWSLKEKSGSAAVWITVQGLPILLIDQEVYHRHHEESVVWFRSLCSELDKKMELEQRDASQSSPGPAKKEKPKNKVVEFLKRNRTTVTLALAGIVTAGALIWGAAQTLSHSKRNLPQTVSITPGTMTGGEPAQAKEITAPGAHWAESLEKKLSDWEETQKKLVDRLRYIEQKSPNGGIIVTVTGFDPETVRELKKMADSMLSKRREVYTALHDRFEKDKESGRLYSLRGRDDRRELEKLVKHVDKADRVRLGFPYSLAKEHIHQVPGLDATLAEYSGSLKPVSPEMQREFDIINFSGHVTLDDWSRDQRETEEAIKQNSGGGNKAVLEIRSAYLRKAISYLLPRFFEESARRREESYERELRELKESDSFILTMFSISAGVSIVLLILVWIAKSQSTRKYGSQAPFEMTRSSSERSGPMQQRLGQGQRESESQVYGRIENPLPGSFGGFRPLIIGYYNALHNDTRDWGEADVGKRVRRTAQPVGEPTKVNLWGSVKRVEPLSLPNYPYSVIRNVRVASADQMNQPIADSLVRFTRGTLDLASVEFETDELRFDRTGQVFITYDIIHYRPEDIEFYIPESHLGSKETKALLDFFGDELQSYYNNTKSNPIQAIRDLLRAKTYYAADETKSLDTTHATWAESFWHATKGGQKCPVICNTAALLYAMFAAVFGIPFCYVTQIIPDRQGLFGKDIVLTKSQDGHAAVLLKVKDEASSASSWRYEEAVANVGPKPITVDLPHGVTIGLYVELEKIQRLIKNLLNRASAVPGRLRRRLIWFFAIIVEGYAYFGDYRRAQKVFQTLHVTDPDTQNDVLSLLRGLYRHNTTRFLKESRQHPRKPRLSFIYLGRREFWQSLKKWGDSDPEGNLNKNSNILKSIFVFGDDTNEWRLLEDGNIGVAQNPRLLRRRWSPLYGFIEDSVVCRYSRGPSDQSADTPRAFKDEFISAGEALLERGLPESFNETAVILKYANRIYEFVEKAQAEDMVIRLFQLALQDLRLAGSICEYLGYEPRLSHLMSLAVGNAEADQYFPGRERLWAEWIAGGGGMDFEGIDTVSGLEPTDDLLTPVLQERFPNGMSLGWIIDAARRFEEHLQWAGLAVPLSSVRKSILTASEGKTTPLSEREMLGTISAQDQTRMVMIRELIQNSRDAILSNLQKLSTLGKKAAIHVRSYLYRRDVDIFWVLSVKDPVGMNRKTLFEKYFPPKATTKSIQEMVVEILEDQNRPEEKTDRIIGTLIEERYQNDAQMSQLILSQIRFGRNPKDIALEILKKYSDRFKRSLAAGFFGVGNYTVYADADEIVIRTGLDGEADEVWLRIDRNDPEDPGRVTGILALSWNSYNDFTHQYEGTLIQRMKKVSHLTDAYIEDRLVKYLFAEYVGAVDDVEIVFVDGQDRPLNIPVRDPLRFLAGHGDVRVVESGMRIRRVSVDKLFIQSVPDPVLNEFLPKWILQWEDSRAIGLDYLRGTPVVESRTALRNPILHRHATTVARLKAAIRGYREGILSIPGIPGYQDFLRDSRFGSGFPIADSDILDHARQINEGQQLPDTVWKKYQSQSKRFVALLLHLDAPSSGNSEQSLLDQKAALFFNNLPIWVRQEFFESPRLRDIFQGTPKVTINPIDQPEAFSREIALRFLQSVGQAYLHGRMQIPGLPSNFNEFASSGYPMAALTASVQKDLHLINKGRAVEVDFCAYRENIHSHELALLISALPLEGGKSLRQIKEELARREQANSQAKKKSASREQARSWPVVSPIQVLSQDFVILAEFEKFMNRVIEALAREISPEKKMELAPKPYLKLNFSRGGLNMLRAFLEYHEGRLDGQKFYDQLFEQVITHLPGKARIAIYDALLKGDKTVADLKDLAPPENLGVSLEQLERYVHAAGALVYYEKDISTTLIPDDTRMKDPIPASRSAEPTVNSGRYPHQENPQNLLPVDDSFVIGIGAEPGQAIAVSLVPDEPSILRFKQGKDRNLVEVYVGDQHLRTVKTAQPIKESVAEISLSDMMDVWRDFNSKYSRSLAPGLQGIPVEVYIHLDSYKNLPVEPNSDLQESIITSMLSSIAASSANYQKIHLVGDRKLIEKAQGIIKSIGAWKSKETLFVEGDSADFPGVNQIHILTKDYFVQNEERLRQNPQNRFITMDNIEYNQANRTVDIVAFNPVILLVEMIGAMKDLSTQDSSFQMAYDYFRELTGFDLTQGEFSGLLQGDLDLVKRFALPPAIRAVDFSLAVRVWAIGARMAAQAA